MRPKPDEACMNCRAVYLESERGCWIAPERDSCFQMNAVQRLTEAIALLGIHSVVDLR
jgi:hypothetical protein